MAKCGGCGKFMAGSADCIRCTKCPGVYHSACVGMTSARFSPNWLCPGCKAKIPKTDNSATPVKAVSASDGADDNVNAPIHISTPTPSDSVVPVLEPPTVELNVAHEIRCFREELSAMRVELRDFRQEMSGLKEDVKSCRERVDIVEHKVACLEKRFEAKEPAAYDNLEGTIAELKLQLNDRDQDLLLNDVIVTGIPETRDENPIHLLQLVCIKLGVKMDERDIVYAERVGMVRRNFTEGSASNTQRPRALAVRLARRAARDQLLRGARVRRGLTTADIDIAGPSNRLYINERLTPTNSKIYFDAREAGARHKFKYVWTKDGRIYMRKEDGAKSLRIRSNVDIARNFGSVSV